MYIRDQRTLAVDLGARSRDTYNTRWQLSEKHLAISHAVDRWGTRVAFPCQELLSGAWDADTYAYTLPAYVNRETLRVQRNVTDPTGTANVGRWLDVQADVRPLANGSGWQIVTRVRPIADTTARLFWWSTNGALPYPFPTLNAELAADASSLVLASAVQALAPVGYVLVESEWIAYRGVSVGASTTTLQNLTRGVQNTTAAVHAAGENVIWGVVVLDSRLFEQLYNEAQKFLHQLSLQNAAEQAREYHERMVSHHRVLADEFWPGYFNAAWGGTRQRKLSDV